ncbi:MAG: OadG family protein [Firmicutes bacterium]|nr:OadG family protein [Bacillota bacterium]
MDRSAIAFQVVTLGFGVTLTALIALYLLLNIFGRAFDRQKKNTPEPGAIVTTKPVVSVETSPSKIEGRIVAAIVGSISSLLLDEPAKQPFKISITPSLAAGHTGKAWLLTGRKELMTGALKLAALRRRGNHAEV